MDRNASRRMAQAMHRNMPCSLRLKLFWTMLFPGPDRFQRKRVMKEMAARRRFTVPREQIAWYPSVDRQRCQDCQACYRFCPKHVFAVSTKGRVTVSQPFGCVVLCSGCVSRCPHGAISFPDQRDFEHYVYYL